MIAAQRDQPRRQSPAREALDHRGRVGAAVDVIAERDDDRFAAEIARVLVDPPRQRVEEIGPAVHVADDVSAQALRRRRRRQRRRSRALAKTENHRSDRSCFVARRLVARTIGGVAQADGRKHSA
jgi:hypothetical protein